LPQAERLVPLWKGCRHPLAGAGVAAVLFAVTALPEREHRWELGQVADPALRQGGF
jgi:hypothetical protein